MKQTTNNQTTTTTTNNRKDNNMKDYNQAPELTNIKTRNPKLKTAVLIQDSTDRLTPQKYKDYQNKFKKHFNLTIQDIKQHMVTNYQKRLDEYINYLYNRYQYLPETINKKTKNRLIKEAHEAVTNWNIHNNYTNKYIIVINPDKHLAYHDTQQLTKTIQDNSYIQRAFKQALRYKGLNLLIIDPETNVYITHTNHTQLNTWSEINSTYNELLTELQQLIIHRTYNKSPLLNEHEAELYYNLAKQYEDVTPSLYYNAKTYYGDQTDLNGRIIQKSAYVNMYDHITPQPTEQDLKNLMYLISNDILKRRLLTEEQEQALNNRALELKTKITEIYCIDKELGLELFNEYEKIQSILEENELKKQSTEDYDFLSYKIPSIQTYSQRDTQYQDLIQELDEAKHQAELIQLRKEIQSILSK